MTQSKLTQATIAAKALEPSELNSIIMRKVGDRDCYLDQATNADSKYPHGSEFVAHYRARCLAKAQALTNEIDVLRSVRDRAAS